MSLMKGWKLPLPLRKWLVSNATLWIFGKILEFLNNRHVTSQWKANMPEMTIFYVNQAYQSYKDNKKVHYCDFFILGQVTQCLKPPKDLKNYELKEKILSPESLLTWWKHLAI